ncbi:MAG: AraC-like DNA-binding protein [Flavobacteriales bacterium]|jgi:AraC-like DNA-binding protein
MDKVVFNFHDVILWVTAMQCVFFAALLLVTNTAKVKSTYFLAGFLVAHTLIPLNEMILWGEQFRLTVKDNFPELYLVGGVAYYLDGPLLYFCIRTLVFKEFKIKPRYALHFIPLCVFIGFMITSFYRFPEIQRLELIGSQDLVTGGPFILVEFASKCIRVLYCIFGFRLILRYTKLRRTTHASEERIDTTWIRFLVLGFLVVMSMEAFLSAYKTVNLVIPFQNSAFKYIGLSGYYTLFVLVNLLVFTGIRYFDSFEGLRQKDLPKDNPQKNLLNPELANEIDRDMLRLKPYTQTDITLDSLAHILCCSTKDLSLIINRHFGVNFYEFINRYRINEAKTLLHDKSHKQTNITEIYVMVGFNSKSVFNTFFKKIVGVTPSQYRKQDKA